ncbi:MAG: hypothetical protein WBW69_19960 [Candidatus Korobacteraceae bacterium]
MDMSYQEKSILGSLFALVVVYGYYFAATLRNIGREDLVGSLGRLVFAIVATIVIQVVYQIALAIEGTVERKDERDIFIECKAYRNAYAMLATGVCMVSCYFFVASWAHSTSTHFPLTAYLAVNLMLLVWVIAELTKCLTQLFYYRRGL